jgi:hypothetical protein
MILGGINPTHNDCFQPQLFPPTFAVFFPPLCHKKETLIKFIQDGRSWQAGKSPFKKYGGFGSQ